MILENWHLEIIKRQFKLWYGLKQLIQDGKDDALRHLANRTNINFEWLKQNLETIKQL